MKRSLIIILFFTSTEAIGQHYLALTDMERNTIRSIADSISFAIDFQKDLHIKADTTPIYDKKDISKPIGLFIEQIFIDSNRVLRKAIVSDQNAGISIYYFSGSLLIKVITTQKKSNKQEIYYYNIDDNELSSPLISRILLHRPSFEEYFTKLQVGQNFVSQYLTNQKANQHKELK